MIIIDSDSKRGSDHSWPTSPGSRNSIASNNIIISGDRVRSIDNGRVLRNNTVGRRSDSYYSRSNSSLSSSESSTGSDLENPPPYDAPPPAYSLHDEAPSRGDRSRHRAPRSFEGEQRQQYGRSAPEASFPSASVGTPPASALPKNGVSVYESNSSIRGCYIIDPEKDGLNPRWGSGAKNLELSTSNGSVDVDVAVLPPTRASRNSANISLHSSCGSVNLRMHDAPANLIPPSRENRGQQRPTIVSAHSSNGKVHICIPRSFRGLISATTHNGSIKFSDGIQASMTTVHKTNFGSRNTVVFIGDPPPDLPAETVDENENDSDGYSDDNGNVFIFSETGTPGMGGFFSGARNFTIHGSSFNVFPGDANIVYGVSSRGNRPRRSTEPSSSPVFERTWQGNRVTATSSNGNIHIAYDDEHMFGSFGGWKHQSSDGNTRRRPNTTLRNVYIGGNRIDLNGLYEGLGITGLF